MRNASSQWRIASVALAVAAAQLAGCAGPRIIDSEVQTFSTLAERPAPATYRFDRLPSQQQQAAQHVRLEELAAQALGRAGFVADAQAARYTVQIAARAAHDAPGWGTSGWDTLGAPGWPDRTRSYVDGGRRIWAPYLYFPPPPSLLRREVSLLIRELASQRVVYETRALHDGGAGDDAITLQAMFDAALHDFPNPLPGVRRVDVAVPR